jgi:hypothetical protein
MEHSELPFSVLFHDQGRAHLFASWRCQMTNVWITTLRVKALERVYDHTSWGAACRRVRAQAPYSPAAISFRDTPVTAKLHQFNNPGSEGKPG